MEDDPKRGGGGRRGSKTGVAEEAARI